MTTAFAARATEPCSGHTGIEVVGQAVSADALRQRLIATGALIHPRGAQVNCAALLVTIDVVPDERLRVRVVDADGRNSERLVGDIETAAVWVETWLQQAADWANEPREPNVSDGAAPGAALSSSAQSATVGAHRGPLDYQLAFFLEGAASDSQGAGGGLRGRACEQIGPLCLGGGLRLSYGRGGGSSPDEWMTQRFDMSVAAILDYRFWLGPVSLVAGGSLGILWRHESAEAPFDALDRHTVGPEFGASLRAHVPIDAGWSLSAGFFASVAPFNANIYGQHPEIVGPPPEPSMPESPVEGVYGLYSATPWSAGVGVGVHFAGGAP